MTTLEAANTQINADDSLNAIVERFPQALPALRRFGLDLCCGGALPLSVAAQHHGLDLDELMAALRVAAEEQGP